MRRSRNGKSDMKIVVASDSFKGCLSSCEVADAVERGIRMVLPEAEVKKIALADGGEGSTEILVHALQGKLCKCMIHDPLGREIESNFGIINADSTKIGIMDVASSCGLAMLKENERNPLLTSSRGVGETLCSAMDSGCEKICIGLGGSANCDGGAGMLEALGVRFYDAKDEIIHPSGGNLLKIQRIDFTGMDRRICSTEIIALADVDNPLLGPKGASRVFAPQKGADANAVTILENGLRHIKELFNSREVSLEDTPGAGAAGGIGWAVLNLPFASISSGVNEILKLTGFEDKLDGCDLVITGEGKMDIQTLGGKAPFGVMKVAKAKNIPVVAIAGKVEDFKDLLTAGFNGVFSITSGPVSLEESMNPEVAKKSVSDTSASIISLFQFSNYHLLTK